MCVARDVGARRDKGHGPVNNITRLDTKKMNVVSDTPDVPHRPEYFVDAAEAGRFLLLHSRTVMRMARHGTIPAHPLGDGSRKTWRFLLSELDSWVRGRVHSDCGAARVITYERKVR